MKLEIDMNSSKPLNPIWSMGGNTCHAPLWFRDDLKRHLKTVKEQLGFRYVRAHGILNDDMGVVSPDGLSFNFEKPVKGIEGLLKLGLKPFIELSSMPGAFASGNSGIAHYVFRADPPKDWARWRELIRQFASALLSHFGEEEVSSWYFEVWNEPDISFWTGGMGGYFKLYDLSASAIKSVSPRFKVGGPATARTRWIEEFCHHVSKPSPDDSREGIRCDFISTHAYPSDLEFVDADYCDVKLQSANIMKELFSKARASIDSILGKGIPLIAGEWNSSAGPFAFNHDDSNNAAFVAKTMVELSEHCAGSLYWNISDIYEEAGFHYAPFHGGYGLLNVNDFPKAAFHAFRLLHEHSGTRLNASICDAFDGIGCLASKDGGLLRILLWSHVDAGASPQSARISLGGLPKATRTSFEKVLPWHGSAYEAWLALGSPDYVNRKVFDVLEAASMPLKGSWSEPPSAIELEPASIMQLVLELA